MQWLASASQWALEGDGGRVVADSVQRAPSFTFSEKVPIIGFFLVQFLLFLLLVAMGTWIAKKVWTRTK
jgi:hypothetical protein